MNIEDEKIIEQLEKYIKSIYLVITHNEYRELILNADYKNVHCSIRLFKDGLEKDFENYLKYVARDVVELISRELFYKNELKGGNKDE